MALQSVSTKPHPSSREVLLAAATRLRTEVGKRIVGQQPVVEEILIALLAGGHVLLVGVPFVVLMSTIFAPLLGLAKVAAPFACPSGYERAYVKYWTESAGGTNFSVRQTRLFVKTEAPTSWGPLVTYVEGEAKGVRLRRCRESPTVRRRLPFPRPSW